MTAESMLFTGQMFTLREFICLRGNKGLLSSDQGQCLVNMRVIGHQRLDGFELLSCILRPAKTHQCLSKIEVCSSPIAN